MMEMGNFSTIETTSGRIRHVVAPMRTCVHTGSDLMYMTTGCSSQSDGDRIVSAGGQRSERPIQIRPRRIPPNIGTNFVCTHHFRTVRTQCADARRRSANPQHQDGQQAAKDAGRCAMGRRTHGRMSDCALVQAIYAVLHLSATAETHTHTHTRTGKVLVEIAEGGGSDNSQHTRPRTGTVYTWLNRVYCGVISLENAFSD